MATKRVKVLATPEHLRLMRNSETQTYKECRQKWDWAYLQGWKSNVPSAPLTIGSMVHGGLQDWYVPGRKRGVHPAKTVVRLYKEHLAAGHPEVKVKVGKGEDDTARVEIIDLMVEMMNNYVAEYGNDDFVEVLAPEQLFQVDVYHPRSGRYICTQVGQIDLCFLDRRTNRMGFMEHKTGATLKPFGAPEPLDEQSGTYFTYGPEYLRHHNWIGPKDELDFIMFNRMKKAFKDQRPRNAQGQSLNKDGSVSKQQPAPLFKRSMVYRSADDRNILDKRIRAVSDEMAMVQAGELQVYKSPGHHCDYCEFRAVCEVHESNGDWKNMLKDMFHKWNPYDEHVAEMEEREEV